MKVRVPKEHRPPERFKPFFAKGVLMAKDGWYKVAGSYRIPKGGEFFWSEVFKSAMRIDNAMHHPYVILIPCEAPV